MEAGTRGYGMFVRSVVNTALVYSSETEKNRNKGAKELRDGGGGSM